MIEVLVCFVYNVLLYHFVSYIFFCTIVTKLSLEALCNSMYRNRNRSKDTVLNPKPHAGP